MFVKPARTPTTTTVLVTLTLGVVLNVHAHGQIIVVSQSRSVSASATLDCGSIVDASTLSTPAPGVFNQSASEFMNGAESNANGGACIGAGESFGSSGSQNTTVTGAVVQGTGAANAGKAGGALESGFAAGNSSLTVNFQVTAPTSYQLFGQVDGLEASPGGFFAGNSMVSLIQGGTTIHSVSPNPPDTIGGGTANPFAFAGILAPGNYTVNAIASASASGPIESSDSSNYSFTFVPEPTVTPFALLTFALLGMRFRKS